MIGHNHNRPPPIIKDETIRWTKEFKILGINYTTCMTQSDKNYEQPIEEIKKMIEDWNKKLCTQFFIVPLYIYFICKIFEKFFVDQN